MLIDVKFATSLEPGEAFSFIAENFFKNHQKWDPDLIENVKTSDGPIGIGTTGRAVTRFAGKQVADFKITNYSPNKNFAFINTSGAVYLERAYSFEASPNGGTDINFIFDMRPKALRTKIVFPILKAITKKKVSSNIKLLESLLEKAK